MHEVGWLRFNGRDPDCKVLRNLIEGTRQDKRWANRF